MKDLLPNLSYDNSLGVYHIVCNLACSLRLTTVPSASLMVLPFLHCLLSTLCMDLFLQLCHVPYLIVFHALIPAVKFKC